MLFLRLAMRSLQRESIPRANIVLRPSSSVEAEVVLDRKVSSMLHQGHLVQKKYCTYLLFRLYFSNSVHIMLMPDLHHPFSQSDHACLHTDRL